MNKEDKGKVDRDGTETWDKRNGGIREVRRGKWRKEIYCKKQKTEWWMGSVEKRIWNGRMKMTQNMIKENNNQGSRLNMQTIKDNEIEGKIEEMKEKGQKGNKKCRKIK